MLKISRTFGIKTYAKSLTRQFHQSLSIGPNVQRALELNRPVVALESTIFTHGLPYPNNYKMAIEVERLIHEQGAVPATIGFVDGIPTIGMSDVQIELLANPDKTHRPVKVSRRDIAHVMHKELNGGTTIAATMILAQMAGIKVFATGGLGGVHRGASSTFDISADLDELARTNMAVVCSGPKSILDVAKTMEYLETKGVYVSTYGPDGTNVPGFFTTDSGIPSPYNFSSAEEAADIIKIHNTMELQSGLVFCVPSPEDIALPKKEMDDIIDNAVERAKVADIKGKELTPYLLNEIRQSTKGKTLETNIEFVKNNAIMASKIAVSLAGTKTSHSVVRPISNQSIKPPSVQSSPSYDIKALVIGALAVDMTCNLSSASIDDRKTWFSSNPGTILTSAGGVAHNIAVAASYRGLNDKVKLVSEINHEDSGLLTAIREQGILTDGIRLSDNRTAKYIAMHDNKGELLVACADMGTINNMDIDHIVSEMKNSPVDVVALDANMGIHQMTTILKQAKTEKQVITMLEPTSVPKSRNIARIKQLEVFPDHWIDIITPNHHELESMFMEFQQQDKFDVDNWFPVIDGIGVQGFHDTIVEFSRTSSDLSGLVRDGIGQQCFHLLPYMPNILVKLGSKGIISFQLVKDTNELDLNSISGRVCRGKNDFGIVIQHFPANKVTDDEFLSATGAGDTLFGSLVADIALKKWDLSPGKEMSEVMSRGQKCSSLSVKSHEAVSAGIKEL